MSNCRYVTSALTGRPVCNMCWKNPPQTAVIGPEGKFWALCPKCTNHIDKMDNKKYLARLRLKGNRK